MRRRLWGCYGRCEVRRVHVRNARGDTNTFQAQIKHLVRLLAIVASHALPFISTCSLAIGSSKVLGKCSSDAHLVCKD